MTIYHVKVYIQLKDGILDPQGKAVEHALSSLGFSGMSNVRIGKMIELQVEGNSMEDAEKNVERACDKLLTNPIIETYDFELSLNGKAV